MPSDVLGSYLDVWTDEKEQGYRWVAGLLGRFTYKPGWSLEPSRNTQVGGAQLTVAFMAEDSRRGPNQIPSYRETTYMQGEPFRIERVGLIPISGVFIVPPHIIEYREENLFWQWLRQTLHFVEEHESDEWFRVDGNLPYDPHRGPQ